MKILKEFTLDYIFRNKRTSLTIMISILIASTLLSTLCIFQYNVWYDGVRQAIEKNGHWHGELFDATPGNKLKYVTSHPNVRKVMIKGEWYPACIGTNEKRPYLFLRDADTEYWREMSEKNAIIEGRIPEEKSEIAVSKQFIDDNPTIKIGSIISIPVGFRMSSDKKLDVVASKRSDETFSSQRNENFKIVGVLDITTPSIVPGYYAMGYLDRRDIKPDDGLTVYVNFHNPRKIAEDLPQIAAAVGQKSDESGKYLIKYNNSLLINYLIFPESNKATPLPSTYIFLIASVILMVLLCVGVFVLIIHNAFVLSANSRMKQLGMLKSIGATPAQIRKSVTFEAILLSIIPTPLGLLIGHLMCSFLFAEISAMNRINDNSLPVQYNFGWVIALPSVILTIFTVWLSAYLPAKKIGKIIPIIAIRQVGHMGIKKARSNIFYRKLFGFEGELAFNSLSANRKSFRTSFISLFLSFVLFVTFINLNSISDAEVSLFGINMEYDIEVNLLDGRQMAPEVKNEFKQIKGLDLCIFSNNILCTTWFTSDKQSEEIKMLGGFSGIAATNRFDLLVEKDKYRLNTRLVSLDDASFSQYCKSLGINPDAYSDIHNPKGILVNYSYNHVTYGKRNHDILPITSLKAGDIVRVSENVNSITNGDYEFGLQTGFVTDKLPDTFQYNNYYTLTYIIPVGIYKNIVRNFDEDRQPRSLNTYITINCNDKSINVVKGHIKDICDRWYGRGDYSIYTIEDLKNQIAASRRIMNLITFCISGLLGLIGIANTFSTVTGYLQQRRWEFAMLRSVGLSPVGMKKMLILEAVFFGINPILVGLPLTLIITYLFLRIEQIFVYEFIPFMPILEVIIFILIILLCVGMAYLLGASRIKADTIVEVLKDETN